MLSAARKDYRALTGMADTNVFAEEVFGFHAQQAVEKALKAWLALLDVVYPRTHDLSLLLNTLRERRQDIEAFRRTIEFNAYAVQYRYEAFVELGRPLDRKAAIELVGELMAAVEARIEREQAQPSP
jgi:HEPN domain-containing protein